MATNIGNMTVQEFINELIDSGVIPSKREKMTPEEINLLAKKLNKKINIPLLSENREEKILIEVVERIDGFLYENLPNEFYDLIRSSEDGISDEEAKRLVKRLSKLANDKIDIPYIPETMEYIAIRFIVGMVVNAARKNLKIDTVEEDKSFINASDDGQEDPVEDRLKA